MILSDREIQAAIARGGIIPIPCPPPDSPRWTSTTVDLTLDAEVRPWQGRERGRETTPVDPATDAFNANQLIEEHAPRRDCSGREGFVIEPGELVLGW